MIKGYYTGTVKSKPEPVIEHLVKGHRRPLGAQVEALHMCKLL